MAVPVATDRMWVRQDLAGHWPSADGNTVSDFAQPAGTLQFAAPILELWVISMASEAHGGDWDAGRPPAAFTTLTRSGVLPGYSDPRSTFTRSECRRCCSRNPGSDLLVHPGVGRESWIDLTTWPYSHATARLSQRVAVSSRKPTTDISAYTLGGTGSRPVIGSAM
jgi:hypothetical protein